MLPFSTLVELPGIETVAPNANLKHKSLSQSLTSLMSMHPLYLLNSMLTLQT
jgi:hypothetical protein